MNRIVRRIVAPAVLAAALVGTTPAIASAAPNGYHPDITEEAPYYGPQEHHRLDLSAPKADKVSAWGWVLFGVAAAGSLLNPLSW